MKPTVYVDILFLTNFLTNFFLLYMTKSVSKNASPIWRLICGACAGSVYAVLMFYPDLSFIYSGIFKLGISAVIVLISFGFNSVKSLFSLCSLFYLSSFALSGITFALFYFTDVGFLIGAAMSNGVFYVNISPLYLVLSAALCYIVMFVFERVYTNRINTNANMHNLEIFYKGKSIRVKALLDSANAMLDPVTNTPVIVCDINVLKPFFKDESYYERLCVLAQNNSDKLKIELVCDTPFRLVPYRGLGNVSDIMLAFSPTKLLIDEKVYTGSVLIGLCAQKLSGADAYNALLHPRVMATL
ncbi:MAG: sigma-E processing peptidase SpoIIGA [Ruminococcaceae bacterium]|nr:sigma-E processing peptidase SpoIIGA [Oscillospiraceae bacterium]